MKLEPSETELRIIDEIRNHKTLYVDGIEFNEESGYIDITAPTFDEEDLSIFERLGLHLKAIEPALSVSGQALGVILHYSWRTA